MFEVIATEGRFRWKRAGALVAAVWLCSSLGFAQTATVSGIVTRSESKKPVRRALVVAGDNEAKELKAKAHVQVDRDGHYSFDLPAPGHYTMAAFGENCSVWRPGFDVALGERLVFDFALEGCHPTGDSFGPVTGVSRRPYKEEVIQTVDKQDVIIGYGSLKQNEGLTEYRNLEYGQSTLAVTARFRKFTIQGSAATLEKQRTILRVVGSVTVVNSVPMADGSPETIYQGSCVELSLAEPRSSPTACDQGN